MKVKERLFRNCASATAKGPVNTLNIFETFVEGRLFENPSEHCWNVMKIWTLLLHFFFSWSIWSCLSRSHNFFCTRTIAHSVMINMTIYFYLWRVCFDSLVRRGLNISQHSLDKCCEMTVFRWISLPALLLCDILSHVTVLHVRNGLF